MQVVRVSIISDRLLLFVAFRAFLWQLVLGSQCFILLVTDAHAAEQSSVRSPVSPHESLAHIVVAEGLKVELVAHEPNVIDPVEIRFDEDGRMWVVEMRDYPAGPPDGKGLSRISVLEDLDGDGFFESATVFADKLRFATGLQPWKGGVFVTLAAEVAYMKDTTGDGRADLVETWFRGFAEENTHLRANHSRFALDNHIYVANGLRGGSIVDAQRPNAPPLSISGMDFRFNPITRDCEAVSGASQFGLTFDDYGNRFICTNRNPAIHVVLEDRFLKKNPLVTVAAVTHDVAKGGDQSRVFPITRAWTTSHLHAGQFTAACSLEVYRGDALPAEFYGNMFVCEPTGHLVHREIMKPHGVTFISTPAYKNEEIFASQDEWCCPVNLEVGPDGALYVVDMYRAVIEHPEWMPVELRQRPDLLAGNDRGRIYRIVPIDFRRVPPPRSSSMASVELVDRLTHPNAWWRETAARLLFERQDESIAPQLRRTALYHESHRTRIHALFVLQGFGLATEGLRLRMLDDSHPRVIEEAIAVAESAPGVGSPISRKIAELVGHVDARVRFQAWLTGRVIPSAPEFPTDSWEIEAMLLAVRSRGGMALSRILRNGLTLQANVDEPKKFIIDLAKLAAASPDDDQAAIALRVLLSDDTFRRVGLASFLGELRRRGRALEALALSDSAAAAINQAFDDARLDATDANQPESVRNEAIDLCAHSEGANELLLPLALKDPYPDVRVRAIAALAMRSESEPWKQLLDGFAHATPVVQRAMLEGVLQSPRRTSLLLDAIVSGAIKPEAIDANRVIELMNHRDAATQQRARQVFADATPADRQLVLAEYKPVLSMPTSAARGRAVFVKHCATCHRIAGVGTDIAPDISDSREKSAERLLTDILQPNRAIDANYFSYTAVTTEGQVQTGILTPETSTSITMKQAQGKTITLRRDQIDELQSNGVSFMPDGLEKLIPPQDMADLIAFIKNWRYLPR